MTPMTPADRMTLLLEALPRWTNHQGGLVTPNDVLAAAADIIEAVMSTLDVSRTDARSVLAQTVTLLRAVSETSVATPISRVPQA